MASLQDTIRELQNFDVNDLDVNNIGSWPIAIRIIVLVLVFALVLGGGYNFFLKDRYAALDRGRAQEVALKQDFETKAFSAANLDALKRQREEMEASFGALLRQLPSDTEVPGLIEDITQSALSNGLKIQSIDLQAERPAEFYVELPIGIQVEGAYHDVGAFVSGVANLSRIVTLHDFSIKPSGGTDSLAMTITAKTYRYLDEEGE